MLGCGLPQSGDNTGGTLELDTDNAPNNGHSARTWTLARSRDINFDHLDRRMCFHMLLYLLPAYHCQIHNVAFGNLKMWHSFLAANTVI